MTFSEDGDVEGREKVGVMYEDCMDSLDTRGLRFGKRVPQQHSSKFTPRQRDVKTLVWDSACTSLIPSQYMA